MYCPPITPESENFPNLRLKHCIWALEMGISEFDNGTCFENDITKNDLPKEILIYMFMLNLYDLEFIFNLI